MRHHNSVLHDLLKRVPWAAFERLVEEHEADRRVRRLSTKSQFVALLYGQLSQAASLREIEAGLLSHQVRLYHLGAAPVRRSTLSDANVRRPAAVFCELLALMLKQAHRGLRRALADTTYLIDSTGLRLDERSTQWARFSTGVCGAKVHVIYNPDADQPIYAALSTAKVNDITAAQTMPIEPGATYVFDLGYYDYRWWAGLADAGCRIVTRFKKNTPLYLLFCNDLDATAKEIADLYKRRWAIELFFRWIKQTLKIRHFLGASENAVRIQVAVALIAFVLLRLAQEAQNAIQSPLAFARLVRANLMHRRRIDRLIEDDPSPIFNPDQLVLQWA